MADEDDADFTAMMTGGAAADDASGLPGRVMEGLPHTKEIGLRLIEAKNGRARVMVPFDPRLVGDPATGVPHGGFITTLLDTCCGSAAMSAPGNPLSTATLDLRIDYLRGAEPGVAIYAEAECTRIGRSIAFLRAVAYEREPEDPVATATGAFMINFPKAGEGKGA